MMWVDGGGKEGRAEASQCFTGELVGILKFYFHVVVAPVVSNTGSPRGK